MDLRQRMRFFYSNSVPYLEQLKKHSEDNYSKFLDSVMSYAREGSKILDLGCGVGVMTAFLHGKGHDCFGVDISPLFIREAKRKSKGKFRVMDVTDLKFRDSSFDVVISAETIEHVLDPEAMLKEAARVLKKGGLLMLRFPNQQNKFKQALSILKKKPLFELKEPNLSSEVFGEDEDLCYVASSADIKLTLKKLGLKILESKPFFWRAGLIVARKE